MSSKSNLQTQLPSIYELQPLEKGGEVARQGFIYQDHVGASFCLDMIEREDLIEVWFETHDDIMLIWQKENGAIKVEFVQVKHEDRQSRWSVAALTARDKKLVGDESDGVDKQPKLGTSLLEKSLNNSRCKEETCFRIVTSFDVDSVLEVLKLERLSAKRVANKANLTSLSQKIKERLGEVSAPDGTVIEEWTERCYWDKRPETVELIQLENLYRLERIAKDRKQVVYSDHRDELYKRLLALVSAAALAVFDSNPNAKRITRREMIRWWEEKVREINESGPSTKTMIHKMERAGIPSDVVLSAEEIRMAYLAKRLDFDYVSGSSFKNAEKEITSILQLEVSKLDSGEISDNGREFHTRCLKKLGELAERSEYKKNSITLPFLQGYMYERANRCVHRFDRAQP